jgi:hypothetical protein
LALQKANPEAASPSACFGNEWVDGYDPLTNGFLSRLKQQFVELEQLEAFVALLNEEKTQETP